MGQPSLEEKPPNISHSALNTALSRGTVSIATSFCFQRGFLPHELPICLGLLGLILPDPPRTVISNKTGPLLKNKCLLLLLQDKGALCVLFSLIY